MHLVQEGVGILVKNQVIDFVIPWVDGSDSVWLAEKNKYLQELEKDTYGSFWIDAGDNRYRDWGNLHYWFRAVEKYAPWVNRIHLIVWRDVPDWLQTEHPKLHIVRHADYIPADCLPVFSSHPIELNMHRIPGLAEQFVYFNDDMFLTAPVRPEDFFRNGIPCDTFAMNAIYFGKDSVGPINGNNVSIINDHFPKKDALKKNWMKYFSPVNGLKNLVRSGLLIFWPWFPGFLYSHTSTNLLKSTMETVWDLEKDALDKTCSDRFRQQTNVNQWLFKYWQLAEGNFVPVTSKDKRCYHIKESIEEACDSVVNRKFKILCINDTGMTTDFEDKAKKIQEAFEKALPDKSKFEL